MRPTRDQLRRPGPRLAAAVNRLAAAVRTRPSPPQCAAMGRRVIVQILAGAASGWICMGGAIAAPISTAGGVRHLDRQGKTAGGSHSIGPASEPWRGTPDHPHSGCLWPMIAGFLNELHRHAGGQLLEVRAENAVTVKI